MSKQVLILCAVLSAVAQAQTPPPTDFSPPPMVPVGPPPTPTPEPGAALTEPGTPPPPSLVPPPGYLPGRQPGTNYPYSPYGTPRSQLTEKPPLEWGYMISESLFGMLTSAGITLLPYFLLLRPMVQGQSSVLGDPAVDATIFVLIFASVPLAVMQTQVSLANGSRYYISESWPAALAGLAAQGLVLSIFLALPPQAGYLPVTPMSGKGGAPEIFLLIGSVAFTPLVQMAVINLTKSSRMAQLGAVSRDKKGMFALGMPAIGPMVAQTRKGLSVGVQASLINFSW